jgi:hypothetical protein
LFIARKIALAAFGTGLAAEATATAAVLALFTPIVPLPKIPVHSMPAAVSSENMIDWQEGRIVKNRFFVRKSQGLIMFSSPYKFHSMVQI